MSNAKGLTSNEVAAYQSMVARGIDPAIAREEALDGLTVDDVRQQIGVGVLGDVPTCNGRCGYNDDDMWVADRDCPIDGDFADQQEAPPAEGGKDITPPAGDVSESTGRTTTP